MYLGLFKGQNSVIDISKSNSGLEPSTSYSCFILANLSETRLDTKESSHLKDPYVLGEHLGWGQQDPPHLQLNWQILDLQLTSILQDKVCMGIILYILLSGMPPFWGKTKSRIFEAVKAADLRFPSEPWDHISKSAKDLIKPMFEPCQRLTALQVLDHCWMESNQTNLEQLIECDIKGCGEWDVGDSSFSVSFMPMNQDIRFGAESLACDTQSPKLPMETLLLPLWSLLLDEQIRENLRFSKVELSLLLI
ncbi:hypothetical protein K1719_032635 [Acacia pycnantha]|nr:hypothetical protein K1719_032635 [Acacia pycnantha]